MKVSQKELAEAMAMLALSAALDVEGQNWYFKANRDLGVGDRLVTKFDRRTNKAMAGVKITKAVHHPAGCSGHVHIEAEEKTQNGCYDHCARTAVFA